MKPSTKIQLQSRLYKWLMRRTTSSSVRRVGELPIAIGSDIGNSRDENQDRVAVLKVQIELNRTFVVVALCDGMGGMQEGAACASQTLATFFVSCIENRNISPENRLSIAADDANRVVHALYKGNGGATLSAILIDHDGSITGVNVGDSRIYSYAEKLEQLTVDDTIAGLRPNLASDFHSSKDLLQYIGMGNELEVHILKVPKSQNWMILTSDGAHYFEKSIIQMVIQNATEPAVGVKRLIEIAKWCGGRDNASIAIVTPMIIKHELLEDTGFVQVWDSFGELQMIVSEEMDNLHNKLTRVLEKNQAVQNVVDELKPPIKQAKRRKSTKKKKPGQSASIADETATEQERPLLNIYFNGDVGKDDHNG